MGKKLIIKGADFSQNAISEEFNITNLLTVESGINGFSYANSGNRSGIIPRFDLSNYLTKYTKIKIITKITSIFFITEFLEGRANNAFFIPPIETLSFVPPGIYESTFENLGESQIYLGANVEGLYDNINDVATIFLIK